MANSIRAAAARVARGLSMFVLVAAFHARQPSHRLVVSAEEDCDGDAAIAACTADEACAACFAGWSAVTSASDAACDERFPDATSPCEQDGADFCCNLGDETTASACMSNELFVGFLGCFMEDFQCSVEDMPCFDGGVFNDTTSPATLSPATLSPATLSPTLSPTTPTPFALQRSTVSPSSAPSSSSFAERGLELTASPTSSAEVGEGAASGADSAMRLSVAGRNFIGFGVACVAFLLEAL